MTPKTKVDFFVPRSSGGHRAKVVWVQHHGRGGGMSRCGMVMVTQHRDGNILQGEKRQCQRCFPPKDTWYPEAYRSVT